MNNFQETHILLVGPGALGTYFAARLGQKFRRLWVLDHRPARAAQLQERGFHVTGSSVLDWIPPEGHVSATPKGWPEMNVVFYLVKATSLKRAVLSCGRVVGRKTSKVLLQNGWGAERDVKGNVVLGVTEESVTLQTSGRVFHAAARPTQLDAASPSAKNVAALLRSAGFDVRLAPSFVKERWWKLIMNACMNPLGALADVPNGRLAEPPLKDILEKVVEECVALSAAAGHKVSLAEARHRVMEIVHRTAQNRNSLGQDLARGRLTERAYLLDPFLKHASGGRRAPVLSFLDRLVRRVEKLAAPD